MENIIITNKKELEKKVKRISQQGKERFHVVSDFDRTLTRAFVNDQKVRSIISVLRDGDYLTPEYRERAQELAKHYGSIEEDPSVSYEEKKKAMLEWWTKHFDLLIKTGLSKSDLERVVKERKVKLRVGVRGLIKTLNQYEIPLVIMSSSGLGDAIPMYLKENRLLFKNIHIITNFYIWDKDGRAMDIRKPIIHSMNKDETSLRNFPFYNQIKSRKNVLLLGNNLGDLGMVEGFPYDGLIKIGFLNEDVEENIETFRQAYDIVVLNDGNMGYVNRLVRRIIGKN